MTVRLRRILPMIIASMTVMLSDGSPALAGQGDIESTCGDGRVCMWEDPNFGDHKWVDQSTFDGKVYDIDWWDGDNEISSIRNNSGFYICVYAGDLTWGGDFIIVGPEREYASLAQSFGFDNDAESFKVVDQTSECN